jgi:hypothetical protein
MKNKFIYLLLAITLVVTIVGGFLYQQVSAQQTSLREFLFPASDSSDTLVIQEISEPSEVAALTQSERFPNSVFVELEQKTTNEDIIAYAKELTTKANQTYLTPGWLHISSRKEAFITVSATLPDGSPIPTKSSNDLWVLLGSDGYAIQAVVIDDTGDSITSQTTVFQDGFWTNLTFPELSSQEKETYRITSLDNDFVVSGTAYKDIRTIEKAEAEVNGEQVVIFSVREDLESPISIGKSSLVVAGFSSKFYFSLDTGLLRMVEDYLVFPGGETKLASRITYVSVEKIDTPPAEILAYFK